MSGHHYLVAVGGGEITRHWFRPLCQPTAPGQRIPEGDRSETPPPDPCVDCNAIIDAAVRRHPAGSRRR